MSLARRPRASRSSLVALAAVLAVPAAVVAVPGVAAAEGPRVLPETVVGELVQAWPEHRDHEEAAERGDEGPLSFVRTRSGDSVRVPTDDVAALPVGATVALTVGLSVPDEASREDGYEKARDVLSAEVLAPPAEPPAAAVTGTVNHPVTVVMAVPRGGARDGTRLSDVVDTVNGPVAEFWEEQSDGGVRFGVTDQQDWVTLDVGCSDPWALWTAAARAAGFDDVAGRADHLVVYVSSTGCSDGLGTVGPVASSGGYSYVRYPTTSIIAHELGHNLGLGHSSLLQCDGKVSGGTCATTSYMDLYDVMGASWGPLGSLAVAQGAGRVSAVSGVTVGLNWNPETTHTVTLVPVSSAAAGTNGIDLRDGGTGRYWLEYRPPSGRDAWLGTSANRYGLQPGVLLRKVGAGGDTSLLLDGTPSPRSAWGSDLSNALPVGTTVRLDGWRGAGVLEITVTAATATEATVRIVPKSAVTLAYEASGGAGGPMGAPTWTEQTCGTVGGKQYCERRFANGIVSWTPEVDGGGRLTYGHIHDAWAAGGTFGTFGFPTTDTTCGLAASGCRQHFVGANLYWSPGTGAVAVRGNLRTAYESAGEESGVLGYPVAAEICSGGVCRQDFQAGSLVSGPATGTRLVPGEIAAVWAAQGYQGGALGLPVSGYICGLRDGGCGQVFQGGRIYRGPGTGAHAVSGAIQAAWIAQGWENGRLGYPTGAQACGLAGGGCRQAFQGGTFYWSTASGAHAVSGAVATAWQASGGEGGPAGYPTTGLICGLRDGGCGQVFQGGRVYDTAATGAHLLTGTIHSAWVAQGFEVGRLGYATGDQVCGLAGGGCKQAFQGGTLYSSATGDHAVSGAVATAWTAAGAEGGTLGYPRTGLICGLKDGGCGQVFQGGRIYDTAATGAHPVSGPVHDAWVAQGYEVGPLGYATGALVCGLVDGGCGQRFQGGRIYGTPVTGMHAMTGAVATAWVGQGYENGPLRYPTTGLICGMKDGGCGQVFQGGRIYTTPRTGAHAVSGDVHTVWGDRGFEAGPLGYPVTGLICGMRDGGCGQVFQGGRIYSTPGTGTHAMTGAIHAAWTAQGYEVGPLGYPTGNQVCGLTGGGCKQEFQGGTVHTRTGAGTHAVTGAIATAWAAAGGEAGSLGYPVTGLICGMRNGGCGQVFQGGRIYSTPGTGTHAMTGPIHAAWTAQGYEVGRLGYPTGDLVCGLAGGGCKQDFQGGTTYSLAGAGTHTVPAAIATAWAAGGGEGGPLGYPTSGLICGLKDGGCGQVFQGGRIYDTAGTGAHSVTGAIQSAWIAQGWEVGRLGYPVAEQVCGLAGGGCRQDFQGGTVYSLPGVATQAVSGAIATAWTAAGAEGGSLGYPVSGLICGLRNGGCGQVFQGGRIYDTPATGAHAVAGAIQDAWIAQGWETGPLGYPTSDTYAVAGGTAQDFQGGRLTLDTVSGRVARS